MRKFSLSLFLVATAASPLVAQSRWGSDSKTAGNSSAGVSRVATSGGDVTRTTARSSSLMDLIGRFLGRELSIASVRVDGSHDGSGNKVKIKVAGLTVFERALPNGGSASNPIVHLTVFDRSYTVVDFGVAAVKLTASAGGGAQASVTLRGRISPPAAHISAAYQVYGNAEGAVSAEVLWGAFTAKASAGVNFWNTTIRATLPVEASALANCRVDLDWILFQLYVKAKIQALWGLYEKERTLVDVRGPSGTYRIL